MTITERNVLICKTFFNIAHCLCHVLDVKSWFLILETNDLVPADIADVVHIFSINGASKAIQAIILVASKAHKAYNK